MFHLNLSTIPGGKRIPLGIGFVFLLLLKSADADAGCLFPWFSIPKEERPVTTRQTQREFSPVSFRQVKMTDSFWAPRIQTNRKETIPYIYDQCKATGRIDAFTWKPGEPRQPHVFWDSDVAKWMEGAAYSLALHPDKQLEKEMDEVIAAMGKLQQDDGYLNSHFILVEPEKRWANLRDCHELYCAGHLMEAAVAYHDATGKKAFLDIICRYADYIDKTFGPDGIRGYPGHEEIELALVKLYRATGEHRYLRLAEFFVNERGRQPHYYAEEAIARHVVLIVGADHLCAASPSRLISC